MRPSTSGENTYSHQRSQGDSGVDPVIPSAFAAWAVSHLVRLVAEDESEPVPPPRCPSSGCSRFPQNWGGTELNRVVTCMVLRATANDMRRCSPLP
ncbi:hypothetical protein TNCV_5072601 [Trichonephila clavipes]|nr:hypothetical protein TNCV_5072601 [Trichonephila clavipes]